ncbi:MULTISPECIES: phosphotransferase [unclassified Micromonospora]|uniref:phosphotransferase n=1 Tax=unclassified Micromonospora TaxID=2617518 RepID=UPI00188E0E56|nr:MULTISPECIES: phosphotransferase [unclassified Micromonospora]MBF5031923.1 phosphotransferase [Micromonospora sp. ANENR4]MCZ7475112.1 phosphotransferase [Micromonospora sp. WMMC273]WBC05732.1 phosphotransferase [Micromonospora sp. WMMA1976]
MASSEGAAPEPAAAGGPPPAPLATGRTADVWLLPGGRVLRRYRAGGDVRAEAEVMRHLRRAGYPVPRVHHADGADLVLDRITGPTLVEAFRAGTVTAPAGARMLADLHARLHALPALRSADPAVRILHLDLHPDNVLLTATGPVVIDWTDSAEGPPALDRTTTALILAEVAVTPGHPLRVAAGELLSAYVAVSGPLDRLMEAVRHRAAGRAPDPELLPEAAVLVTEMIRTVGPAAAQPSSVPPRSRS